MFVRTLHIRISEWIRISSEDLSPLLERKLHERLVFTNPDYELRHNRGEWIGNIAPQISCLRHKGRSYFIPRGFWGQLVDLCEKHLEKLPENLLLGAALIGMDKIMASFKGI